MYLIRLAALAITLVPAFYQMDCKNPDDYTYEDSSRDSDVDSYEEENGDNGLYGALNGFWEDEVSKAGELSGAHFEPNSREFPDIPVEMLDGIWQNALGETLVFVLGQRFFPLYQRRWKQSFVFFQGKRFR